jgi:hypothetical protein
MSENLTLVDISRMPDLRHLAEEVQTSQKPRFLKVKGETLAIIMPVGIKAHALKKQKKTTKDYKVFRAAAGSWKDVDPNLLLNNIYKDRQRTNVRSSVKL